MITHTQTSPGLPELLLPLLLLRQQRAKSWLLLWRPPLHVSHRLPVLSLVFLASSLLVLVPAAKPEPWTTPDVAVTTRVTPTGRHSWALETTSGDGGQRNSISQAILVSLLALKSY